MPRGAPFSGAAPMWGAGMKSRFFEFWGQVCAVAEVASVVVQEVSVLNIVPEVANVR